MAAYDTIGRTYTRTRRADPHVEARIHAALGDARTVVNVGAGAGSYEPRDRPCTAVEPSVTMLAQRPDRSAPAVRATAESLPFADSTFDVAMATLTLHHWHDLRRGVAEMRRVAARQVVFYFEQQRWSTFWLVADYFPSILTLPTDRNAPGTSDLERLFAVESVEVVPVPPECTDGFGAAFWKRPEAYLEVDVQEGMSSFPQLDPVVRARGTERLRRELATGEWDAKYGHLRALDEYDAGYRLLVASG